MVCRSQISATNSAALIWRKLSVDSSRVAEIDWDLHKVAERGIAPFATSQYYLLAVSDLVLGNGTAWIGL